MRPERRLKRRNGGGGFGRPDGRLPNGGGAHPEPEWDERGRHATVWQVAPSNWPWKIESFTGAFSGLKNLGMWPPSTYSWPLAKYTFISRMRIWPLGRARNAELRAS